MSVESEQAFAIKIGDRFFYKLGSFDQVQTAWCLAGARLYQFTEKSLIDEHVEKIVSKGKCAVVCRVYSIESEKL